MTLNGQVFGDMHSTYSRTGTQHIQHAQYIQQSWHTTYPACTVHTAELAHNISSMHSTYNTVTHTTATHPACTIHTIELTHITTTHPACTVHTRTVKQTTHLPCTVHTVHTFRISWAVTKKASFQHHLLSGDCGPLQHSLEGHLRIQHGGGDRQLVSTGAHIHTAVLSEYTDTYIRTYVYPIQNIHSMYCT